VIRLKIQKAAEDYLEAMLMMREKHGYIRSVDVAEQIGVTKPSVSYATKRLRENGYITMDPDGLITLTAKGLEIAERMYERHKLLAQLLERLGVSAETAREDACKIEHDLSVESFEAIRAFAKTLL
jgi:Mn-dependent DtxR family transcriptional regulator